MFMRKQTGKLFECRFSICLLIFYDCIDEDANKVIPVNRQNSTSLYNKQYIVSNKSYMQQYNHLYTKRIALSRDIIE